jgi:hypothetical protein
MVPTYLFVCLFAASLKMSGLALLMNSVVCVGIQVSAFRKITEPSSCADQPSNISASGLQELSSPRSKLQRQVYFSPCKLSSSI